MSGIRFHPIKFSGLYTSTIFPHGMTTGYRCQIYRHFCGFETRSSLPFDRQGGPAQDGSGQPTREGRPIKKLLISIGVLVALLVLAGGAFLLADPLGSGALKGYRYGDLYRSTTRAGGTRITRLVSDGSVRGGVAEARDVAVRAVLHGGGGTPEMTRNLPAPVSSERRKSGGAGNFP